MVGHCFRDLKAELTKEAIPSSCLLSDQELRQKKISDQEKAVLYSSEYFHAHPSQEIKS